MPCWAQGMQMRDGKALSYPEHSPRSSHSLGITAQVHLLMEPYTMCCLSNLNSGWFTTIINDDFFMLPCSASALAQHSGWAPALKVGSWILGAFSHHGATPCIISKDWYLLPTPSAWCFLSGPTAWHIFARNPEQFPSPFRWLCFEYWEFEHLPH